MIFRRFPTTFRRFSKIALKARRRFPNIFQEFPKISEDVRRLPKTFEEDSKMFWWYTNEFKYNLRDKLDITKVINIFTCKDIISLHVRISYRFYQFVTTRYTTDFYIINLVITLSNLSELPNTNRNRSNQQASLLYHNLFSFNPILQENSCWNL